MTATDTPTILPAGYHHGVPLAAYIKDPAPEPSLSTGTVCELVNATPQLAHFHHPRLGKHPSENTKRGEIGSAVHAQLLGGEPILYAPDAFKDWKKDAAKEFRDGVRAEGGIPLLAHQRRLVERAASAGRRVLDMLGAGKTEVTMLWQSHGVWQRGRTDWLSDGPVMLPELEAPNGVDVDVKTVELIDRVAFIRNAVSADVGYDVQHSLRHIGHETLTGKRRVHLWLLVEIGEDSTHDATLVAASDDLLEIGRRKVVHASKLWRTCLDTKAWPGYGRAVSWASAPSYAAWDLENRGVQ